MSKNIVFFKIDSHQKKKAMVICYFKKTKTKRNKKSKKQNFSDSPFLSFFTSNHSSIAIDSFPL